MQTSVVFKDTCHSVVAVGDYPAVLRGRTIVSAYCSGMFFQLNFVVVVFF